MMGTEISSLSRGCQSVGAQTADLYSRNIYKIANKSRGGEMVNAAGLKFLQSTLSRGRAKGSGRCRPGLPTQDPPPARAYQCKSRLRHQRCFFKQKTAYEITR